MDFSICAVTPETMRRRGSHAYDLGRGIDDHGMNPGSPAIADWRKGWQKRQAQVAVDQLLVLAIGMTPP